MKENPWSRSQPHILIAIEKMTHSPIAMHSELADACVVSEVAHVRFHFLNQPRCPFGQAAVNRLHNPTSWLCASWMKFLKGMNLSRFRHSHAHSAGDTNFLKNEFRQIPQSDQIHTRAPPLVSITEWHFHFHSSDDRILNELYNHSTAVDAIAVLHYLVYQ